jgi:hypothetical protein
MRCSFSPWPFELKCRRREGQICYTCRTELYNGLIRAMFFKVEERQLYLLIYCWVPYIYMNKWVVFYAFEIICKHSRSWSSVSTCDGKFRAKPTNALSIHLALTVNCFEIRLLIASPRTQLPLHGYAHSMFSSVVFYKWLLHNLMSSLPFQFQQAYTDKPE